MPRSVSFISSVHHKANCARRVTFTQHVRDLSVGHHTARRYAAHDSIDTFTILSIRTLFGLLHETVPWLPVTGFAAQPAPARRRQRLRQSSAADRSTRSHPPGPR